MKPPAPRSTVTESVNATTGKRELRITLPAPRQWYITVFYAVWLGVWIPAGSFLVYKLFTGTLETPSDTPPFFLPIWLVGWFFGGLFASLTFLWTTFGVEEVRISGDLLVLERRVWGLRWTRAFDRAALSFLRVTPTEPPAWWQGNNANQYPSPFQNRGNMAFDYGAKTFRFGSGIDDAEAFLVLDRLNAVLER